MYIREPLLQAWATVRSGRSAEALAHLESLRANALSSPDAIDRARFFHALAAVLDGEGQTECALEAAREAVAIDSEHHPESNDAFVSLYSLILLLVRLGHKEEAGRASLRLLALGERFGGLAFAAAAVQAAPWIQADRREALLERARFHCKVALKESPPKGDQRYTFAETLAATACMLTDIYATQGRFGEAEELLFAVTLAVAPLIDAPALRRALAVVWTKLAHLASRRGARSAERLYLRFAANVLVHPLMREADRRPVVRALARTGGAVLDTDPSPLDAFRLVRTEAPLWVAHPLKGCRPMLGASPGVAWQWGIAIDVLVDKAGVAHTKQ